MVIILRSAAVNIVLIVISIISIIYIITKKNNFFFQDNLIKLIIIFFGFVFINSLIQFQNTETVLKTLANYRYLLLTFGVFITLQNLTNKNFKIFIYSNLALMILIGLDIFYQYNFSQNVFGFLPGMCDDFNQNCERFAGIFGSRLVAGTYLSQIGLLIFFLVKDYKKSDQNFFQKFIVYFYLFFLFLIILLTGERNAMLIFLMCIFLFFIFQKKKIIYFFILIFIFFTTFILLIQNSDSIKSRYGNIFNITSVKEKSLLEKFKYNPWSFHYQAAFELFMEKPILGHGYRSFRYKCEKTKIDKYSIDNIDKYGGWRACSTHPHNYLMEFLSENGTVGSLFFLTFFAMIFYKVLNINKKSEYLIAFGVGILLLSVLFPLKPSGSFFTTFNASILFYLLGFFIYYFGQVKKNEK